MASNEQARISEQYFGRGTSLSRVDLLRTYRTVLVTSPYSHSASWRSCMSVTPTVVATTPNTDAVNLPHVQTHRAYLSHLIVEILH
jgi:hypothetical protein